MLSIVVSGTFKISLSTAVIRVTCESNSLSLWVGKMGSEGGIFGLISQNPVPRNRRNGLAMERTIPLEWHASITNKILYALASPNLKVWTPKLNLTSQVVR